MNREWSIDSRFHILKRMFSLAGTPLIPGTGGLIYSIYRFLVVVSGYLTLLITFIGIVQNKDDINYIMESARPGFVMVNLLWMHFFISMKMRGVRKLLNMTKVFTWSELPARNSDTGSLTMAGWIPKIQKMMWRFNFIDWIAHTLYLVLRSFTRNDSPLFFNAWFPLDTNSSPGYELALTVQSLGSVMLATTLFAVMGLYVAFVAVGCTQLEKIQNSLLDMKHVDDRPSSEIYDRLVECVQQHQYVLTYMKELEKTFSLVLLGPFLSVVAALCFTAFTAITISGKFVEIIQILIITFAMLFQIQAVCWFGTELTTESNKIRKAAWESEWVGAPIPFQRSLIFMIAVSKEFTLTAGKIIPISRRTMMTVLNETYTYLMFLLNFVDKSSRNANP